MSGPERGVPGQMTTKENKRVDKHLARKVILSQEQPFTACCSSSHLLPVLTHRHTCLQNSRQRQSYGFTISIACYKSSRLGRHTRQSPNTLNHKDLTFSTLIFLLWYNTHNISWPCFGVKLGGMNNTHIACHHHHISLIFIMLLSSYTETLCALSSKSSLPSSSLITILLHICGSKLCLVYTVDIRD